MVSLLPLVASSPTFSLLGELAEASLSKLLVQKEGSTLKKRWCGWQLWRESVAAQNLQPQNAGLKGYHAVTVGRAWHLKTTQLAACELGFGGSGPLAQAGLVDFLNSLAQVL